MVIFHYGGHADGEKLRLEGNDADATGLAKLFADQKQLVLVFLNGCSTLGQVDKLMELGVKAVIATSVEINDKMAVDFSDQFYQMLANKGTIREAYRHAAAFLKAEYQKDIPDEAVSYRSIGRKKIIKEEKDELPWALYINDEKADEVLKWKLPELKPIKLPEGLKNTLNEDYKVNQYLTDVVFALGKHSKSVHKKLTEEDEHGEPLVDKREYPELIIKSFPWPMAAQLRILLANSEDMNKAGLPRLKQLVHSYFVSSKFLSFILLSQLWDSSFEQELDLDRQFVAALEMDEEVRETYDFMPLVHLAAEALFKNNISLFIPEFEALLESIKNQDEVYQAYTFLENVQDQITANELSETDAAELCNQSENCLATFLKKIAFLAKYRLVTVKDVLFIKHRHKPATYRIQLGVLNVLNQDMLNADARDKARSTDTHSVVLVKNLKELDEYLSVSPFIIDKNAYLKKPIPNIYMFDFFDGKDVYHYLNVSYNTNKGKLDPGDQLRSTEEGFELLQEQFKDLSRALNAYRP